MAEIFRAGKERVLYELSVEKEVYLRGQLEKLISEAREGVVSACERARFSDFSFFGYHLIFRHGRDLLEGWQRGVLDLNLPEKKFFALPRVKKKSQEYLDRVMDEIGLVCYLDGMVYLAGFENA